MKIVRLGQDKIRVNLSVNDFEDMNIDMRRLTPESPELRGFLCAVMEAVKTETGFSADSGRVTVEAVRSADGMSLTLSRECAAENAKPGRARRTESIVFEFPSSDSLFGMLGNISAAQLLNMRLYLYRDKYYIAMPKRRVPPIVYEYSLKSRRSAVAESVVAEYGSFLADGYRLACMSAGIKRL